MHSLDFTLLNFYWCLSQASTCLFNCVLLLFVVVCYFQFRSFVRFIKGNITLSNNAFQPVEMNCLSHVTVQLQIRLPVAKLICNKLHQGLLDYYASCATSNNLHVHILAVSSQLLLLTYVLPIN